MHKHGKNCGCKAMGKAWMKEEKEEMGVTPCSKEWLKREMKEPWHKSLHKSKKDWHAWEMEEMKEKNHPSLHKKK